MTTSEERRLLRRYVLVFWITFPVLLIFGLAFAVRRLIEPLPKVLQLAIGAPFAIATALTNFAYNWTAAVFIFRERPPKGETFFSGRMRTYYREGKHPKLRRHLCRMIQSFDPEHFDSMDDL